ncbi:MAG: class I SAM-dependent methyltransferase [Anaerolineales bacterium]|nr:class I SAM-dependent methyltransferase [Anaerolineales bacterium]
MTDDILRATRDIWNENAAFWDERGGNDGLPMQRALIAPITERLLDLKRDERVLEIACGNGAFTRRMAALGARVVACDFAETFIERAKARTIENADRIEYRVIDATDETALLALGAQSFDAVVCAMGLMDMPEIDPLMRALSQLLKPRGRFVFSISHPCFNSTDGMKMVVERGENRDGEHVTVHAIKISQYATPTTYKGIGIIGQPASQYYFHRPLNILFGACFRAGFVLDALEEPTFDANAQPNRPFSWENYHEIPPVLIARVRLV